MMDVTESLAVGGSLRLDAGCSPKLVEAFMHCRCDVDVVLRRIHVRDTGNGLWYKMLNCAFVMARATTLERTRAELACMRLAASDGDVECKTAGEGLERASRPLKATSNTRLRLLGAIDQWRGQDAASSSWISLISHPRRGLGWRSCLPLVHASLLTSSLRGGSSFITATQFGKFGRARLPKQQNLEGATPPVHSP